MTTVQQKSLGFTLNVPVPDSVDEFDRLAKEAGAALREAIKNVLYRSWNAEFRNTFLHGRDAEDGQVAVEGLDKQTGIERQTEVVKPEQRDAEGKITQEQVEKWNESEDDYANRVWAELVKRGTYPSVEAAEAAFAPFAQQVANLIPFDPAKVERKSAGPKKTPKTYLETAKTIVELTGSLGAAVAKFNAKNTLGLQLPADASLEQLAEGVWKDQLAQAKARAAAYAA